MTLDSIFNSLNRMTTFCENISSGVWLYPDDETGKNKIGEGILKNDRKMSKQRLATKRRTKSVGTSRDSVKITRVPSKGAARRQHNKEHNKVLVTV